MCNSTENKFPLPVDNGVVWDRMIGDLVVTVKFLTRNHIRTTVDFNCLCWLVTRVDTGNVTIWNALDLAIAIRRALAEPSFSSMLAERNIAERGRRIVRLEELADSFEEPAHSPDYESMMAV